MSADVTSIYNAALSELGAARVTDVDEDSVEARACTACYEDLRDAELRAHPWTFAATRTQLAADSDEPEFGKDRSFTLPADYLRVLPRYPEEVVGFLDWEFEGGKIYTNDSAPLNFRYTRRVTDASLFDPLFREALSMKMALRMCEQLTQSNTKQATLMEKYKMAIREARRTNAIERMPVIAPEGEWLSMRR